MPRLDSATTGAWRELSARKNLAHFRLRTFAPTGDSLSVPSDEKSKTETGVTPAGADAGVTPEQIWTSLRTLARQIAVLVRETLRSASHRGMIWLRDRHSAIRAAAANFKNRWPDVKA